MPLLGLVSPEGDDDGRERPDRAGWRDVKMFWAVFIGVIVLIVVL
jgi:hypothetical protein